MHAFIYDPGTAFTNNRDARLASPRRTATCKLSALRRSTGSQPDVAGGGIQGPTLAHNPMHRSEPGVARSIPSVPAGYAPGITVAFGGQAATGSFLFDTGAQLSTISTAMASACASRYRPGYEPGNSGRQRPGVGDFRPGQTG